jgi:2-oxoisovalerate dehydrogenase E2 component (dihydrolipoyl transacylase)
MYQYPQEQRQSIRNTVRRTSIISREHEDNMISHRGINVILRSSRTTGYAWKRLSSTVPFKLADIGEGIAEVELMKWFIREGDNVRAFDRICEVQSDKATVEITSRYDGVIRSVHHEEGSIVKVGAALVDIELPEEDSGPKLVSHEDAQDKIVAPSPEEELERAEVNSTSSSRYPTITGVKVMTTPAIRKLARERNVDLSKVTGTGPKGRIMKEDIFGYLSGGTYFGKGASSSSQYEMEAPKQQVSSEASTRPAVTISSPVPKPQPTQQNASSSSGYAASQLTPSPQSLGLQQEGDVRVPIRGIQRIMVKTMTAALQVPHLTYSDDIQFNEVMKLRQALNDSMSKRAATQESPAKISYLPIMIKAISLSLMQYPSLNATVNADASELTYHSHHNIGVAMDTPNGLLVPVVKGVEKMSIFDIARELSYLQECARGGKLSEPQLQGGTFSISNIGSIGGTHAVPVLVVPQVVIGAFGKLQTLPRYVNSKGLPASHDEIYGGSTTVSPSTIMSSSWSADHRVVDGATIARFSNVFKAYMENPAMMISDLK